MHVILWSFRARTGCEEAFEHMYGPHGDWARLFGTGLEFLGSTLMRGTDGTYLVLDRWTSGEAARAFRVRNEGAYAALDARGERLTEVETDLGAVDV